ELSEGIDEETPAPIDRSGSPEPGGGVSAHPGASASTEDDSDVVGGGFYRGGIGGGLSFADSDGVGAFAPDAALWTADQRERRPEGLLPGGRTAPEAHPAMHRGTLRPRRCELVFLQK